MRAQRNKKAKLESARREIRAHVKRLEQEPEHVLHVAHLALQLFDELADWHHLDKRDRLLLEAAACLHDIGWSVASDGSRHHKHSARLIREQKWRHFPRGEVKMISLIARYHRKALPQAKHRPFANLAKSDQRRVALLAALLRVADALDRRHLQVIQRVRTQVRDTAVLFEMDSPRSVTVEAAAGQKKGDLLRKLAKRDLVFEWTGLQPKTERPITL